MILSGGVGFAGELFDTIDGNLLCVFGLSPESIELTATADRNGIMNQLWLTVAYYTVMELALTDVLTGTAASDEYKRANQTDLSVLNFLPIEALQNHCLFWTGRTTDCEVDTIDGSEPYWALRMQLNTSSERGLGNII